MKGSVSSDIVVGAVGEFARPFQAKKRFTQEGEGWGTKGKI